MRPVQRTSGQCQGRGHRLVVFRQGARSRRQHPGGPGTWQVPLWV